MNSVQFNDESVVVSKVACIGRNYVEHAHELGNAVPEQPVIFCKPNSAISSTLASTHLGETLHYEAEIALLVKGGKFVGVGLGLDLTKRATQSELKAKSLPWERAKAFDGSVVLSDFVTIDGIDDDLSIQLQIDNQLRQNGCVGQMLFKPQALLAELNTFMTLADGDVVLTGTPKGVGEVSAGQVFSAAVLSGEQVLVEKRWVAQ